MTLDFPDPFGPTMAENFCNEIFVPACFRAHLMKWTHYNLPGVAFEILKLQAVQYQIADLHGYSKRELFCCYASSICYHTTDPSCPSLTSTVHGAHQAQV